MVTFQQFLVVRIMLDEENIAHPGFPREVTASALQKYLIIGATST